MSRVAIALAVVFGVIIGKYAFPAIERDQKRPKKRTFEEDVRMYLVVRSDLGMSPGKIAAQCSHAAVMLFSQIEHSEPELLEHWLAGGQAKIVLKCKNEQELRNLQEAAFLADIPTALVEDAGHTEVAPGSATVVGIGPVGRTASGPITGRLRLL